MSNETERTSPIGCEFEDRDSREQGRVILVLRAIPNRSDGHE